MKAQESKSMTEIEAPVPLDELAESLIEEVEEVEEEVEITESPEEAKARKSGWTSKQEWIAAGKDPDDWKSAKNFNEFGNILEALKEKQARQEEINTETKIRLENQRKYLNAMKENEMLELKQKLRTAASEADLDTHDRITKQIEAKQVNESKEDEKATIDQWESENPWIYEGSPKSAYAIQEFARYQRQGLPAKEAIEKMKENLKKHFDTNPNRTAAPMVAGGKSKAGGKGKAPALTWDQLTKSELKTYEVYKEAWTKEEFLTTVQEERENG